MRSTLIRWVPTACNVLLIGCQAPRAYVTDPLLLVSAPTVAEAERVANSVRQFVPDLARIFDVDPPPLRIKVVTRDFPPHDYGNQYGYYWGHGRLTLTRDALDDGNHFILHEVCHAYADQTDWALCLPRFLLEGLCEFVSLSVTGEIEAWRENVDTQFSVEADILSDLWTLEKVQDAGTNLPQAYVYGFRTFDRAGVDRIRRWVREGELTEDRVRSVIVEDRPD